ncbi:hypothetical protein ACRAWD_30865 [Caulobacter segnis]
MAGVVNISIDRNFTGLKLGVEGGESSYHDAKQVRLEAAAGKALRQRPRPLRHRRRVSRQRRRHPEEQRPNIGRWADASRTARAASSCRRMSASRTRPTAARSCPGVLNGHGLQSRRHPARLQRRHGDRHRTRSAEKVRRTMTCRPWSRLRSATPPWPASPTT